MDEDSWIIGLKDFVIRLSAVLVSIRREHKRRLGAAPRLISNLCYCLLFISRTAVILVLLCSADINKMIIFGSNPVPTCPRSKDGNICNILFFEDRINYG